MINIFTVDTEDWYHANYEDHLFENNTTTISTVEENTEVYLDALAKNNSKATFFILGFVAEQHPNLVKKIAQAGHEIASHGYSHQLVYMQTPEEFREDVHHSKTLLEDIIGKEVISYRAPSWSITEDSLWALSILEEEGFQFDSSIFPFKNFLYGISSAPRFPFLAKELHPPVKTIIEIPPSTIRAPGINIPFSGGFYFRVLPYFIVSNFTHKVNKSGHPVIFYLHPREIDPGQPRLHLAKRDEIIHYFGIKRCREKMERLLSEFPCTSISSAAKEESAFR